MHLHVTLIYPQKRLQRFHGNKTMLRISFQSGLDPRLKRRSPPTFATLRGGGYLLFCYTITLLYHIYVFPATII